MKNQKTKIALISIMIFMMSTVMAFAEEVDIDQVNADKYFLYNNTCIFRFSK